MGRQLIAHRTSGLIVLHAATNRSPLTDDPEGGSPAVCGPGNGAVSGSPALREARIPSQERVTRSWKGAMCSWHRVTRAKLHASEDWCADDHYSIQCGRNLERVTRAKLHASVPKERVTRSWKGRCAIGTGSPVPNCTRPRISVQMTTIQSSAVEIWSGSPVLDCTPGDHPSVPAMYTVV